MINPKVKSVLVAASMAISLAMPMAALAQDVPATTVTPTAVNQLRIFDWRWLLPLLLIPLLFMFRRNDRERDYPQTGAGTKGGRIDTMDDTETEE